MRFSRIDGEGGAVEVAAHLQQVAGDPRTATLMGRCLQGVASDAERDAFRLAWQERVRRLLVEHAADPQVTEGHDARSCTVARRPSSALTGLPLVPPL